MANKKKEISTKKTGVKSVRKAVKKTTPKKATVKKTTSVKKNDPVKKKVATKKTVTKTAAKKTAPAAKPKKTAAVNKTKTVAKKEAVIKNDPVRKLADAVVEGILEVKGRNVSILDLKHIHNRVCDYFIICQADSNTQVNAIADSVEEQVKKLTGERPYRKEGFENSEWILVDYVTVVVHIFQSHIRNFYNLESLWADAEITELAFD